VKEVRLKKLHRVMVVACTVYSGKDKIIGTAIRSVVARGGRGQKGLIATGHWERFG